MEIYVFIDLDDTIFQTERKCYGATPIHDAAYGRDGNALSFMTEKQRTLFSLLGQNAHLIPTTARSYDAFRRVVLSFDGIAILDFGGVIINEKGEIDKNWDSNIRVQVDAAREQLGQIHATIIETAEQNNLHIRSRIISDFDMDLYVVTKLIDVEGDDLRRLYDITAQQFTNDNFHVHFNDNNFAVFPKCLNKRHAVQYIIDNIRRESDNEILTIGMGDSETDIDFMAVCDYCLTPRSCQVTRLLMEARNVQR
jgi:hydroxymethylpyrimidine pyrophosphatase-like HAD family hydrolase